MRGVTILGNNSAVPAFDRHPTAQALHWDDQIFLIDCGEGTQMQLTRYKIRRSRIRHIFISHLHGDHYFGLIGLITSLGLMQREEPLHLHAPPMLEDILRMQLEAADTRLPYSLHFHPITGPGLLLDDKRLTVRCFAVQHRIACWGFLFEEKKPPRSIVKEAAIAHGIPFSFFDRLKWGEDYRTKSGEIISNDRVTLPASPPLRYAYSADTLFDPELAQHFRGATLLYHEATFLHDLEERARSRFHATAQQAATMAGLAGAHRLIIGHFSSKYEELSPFLAEAQAIFPNTELALEGVTYRLRH